MTEVAERAPGPHRHRRRRLAHHPGHGAAGNVVDPAMAEQLAAALAARPAATPSGAAARPARASASAGTSGLRAPPRTFRRVGRLANAWHEVLRAAVLPRPGRGRHARRRWPARAGPARRLRRRGLRAQHQAAARLRRPRVLPRRRRVLGARPGAGRTAGAGAHAHRRLAERRRRPPVRAGSPARRRRGLQDAATAWPTSRGRPGAGDGAHPRAGRRAAVRTLEDQLVEEALLITGVRRRPGGPEGVAAFLRAAPADFPGAG